MFERLIESVDPIKCSKAGKSLFGWVSVDQMPRLVELLANQEGRAQAQMQFGQIEQGSCFVTGSVTASVNVVCQRCMEAMPFELNADFSLIFVDPDQPVEELPEEFEPRVVDEQLINLSELLEDELILAMPIVAMHEDPGCNKDCLKFCSTSAIEPEKISETQTHRPLSGLRELLDKESG